MSPSFIDGFVLSAPKVTRCLSTWDGIKGRIAADDLCQNLSDPMGAYNHILAVLVSGPRRAADARATGT